MSKRVLILGSTGSVGRQSLDVLEGLRDSHRVVGLAAARSRDRLLEQAQRFRPEALCLVEGEAPPPGLPPGCRWLAGPDGLLRIIEQTAPDIVLCAITGAAGLPSTLAAAASGATLALANKESMVLAGPLVKAACARSGGTIVPVDSEHSAIAQCLQGHAPETVRRLVLTASGGPFRGFTAGQLEHVTPEQALRHPSWQMGPRITIDSATLMNKALEIVEACQLFDVDVERVHVVVHPQSVVHSMVEFIDGALLAQLSPPDMRLPIRYALGFPGRVPSGAPPLAIDALPDLVFERPDRQVFPCLALGERVARAGGLAGCVLNAANEVAVEAFLARRLPFTGIAALVASALDRFGAGAADDLPTILAMDAEVRSWCASRMPVAAT